MPDLMIRKDTELAVAHVEAASDEGTTLVDAFLVAEMVVLDSGNIIIALAHLPGLLEAAHDLTATVIDVTDRRS
jgi:hypothetical protein